MEREGGIRCCGVASAVLTLLLLAPASHVSGLSITVNNLECLYEYVFNEGDSVSGSFVVVDHDIFWSSDHPGIDFTITSPAGDVIDTLKGTSDGKFDFHASKSGMYKFCFHNSHSTPESVSFYIHVGHIPSEHDLAKDEHLEPINVKIAKLKEAMESITAEQMYFKAREARHRHSKAFLHCLFANESTRRRVIFYTVGQYLLLAFLSTLQVAYIWRLFGKSVAYNRV